MWVNGWASSYESGGCGLIPGQETCLGCADLKCEETTSGTQTTDNCCKSGQEIEPARSSPCTQEAALDLETFVVKETNGEHRFETVRPLEFLQFLLRISTSGTHSWAGAGSVSLRMKTEKCSWELIITRSEGTAHIPKKWPCYVPLSTGGTFCPFYTTSGNRPQEIRTGIGFNSNDDDDNNSLNKSPKYWKTILHRDKSNKLNQENQTERR